MAEITDLLIAGRYVRGQGGLYEDRSPYDGSLVAMVSRASPGQVEEAITAARQAFADYRTYPAHQRGALLRRASELIQEYSEEVATLIAREVGKPLKTARVEVARAATTFRLASEEAGRLWGSVIPMDAVAGAEGRQGFFWRQPIGVVGAITPFNFPLNLPAHKIAPALAVGNTVVWKPTSEAPLTALRLGELLVVAGFPPGTVNVLPATGQVAETLITSPQVAMISFTGSVPVGKGIRDRVGLKRLTLELGSNSGVIVSASADLDQAAEGCVRGGFAYAGQVCISVQRIYVQEAVLEPFLQRFLSQVQTLQVGDPLLETTDVGPMITEEAAQRVEAWIQEALQQGARLLCGGQRQGSFVQPTVLTQVSPQMKVVCEEVFAPLVSIVPYERFADAIAMVNDSRYGLNAGVYTRDLAEAFTAIERLEVGSVIVNDSSAFRADHMPYGGVKESGLGREGVRFAMEEMTEIKFAAIKF